MLFRAVVTLYGLAGAGAASYGLWLWWEPAAFMFAGGFIVYDAWRLSRVAPKGKSNGSVDA